MLFRFIKYLSPVWYFNLRSATLSLPYFVDYRKLDRAEQSLLNIDRQYNTEEGLLADAAYQALQKGIMKKDSTTSLYTSFPGKVIKRTRIIKLSDSCEVTIKEEPFVKDIHDNYRFIRRFFNPGISWYILFLRLLSLHSPIKEISGFIAAMKVSRINPYSKNAFSLYKNDYESFNSALIQRSPKISVIIPTLNRYVYLKDVLSDLEKQDYKNFEVIVCDQSDNIDDKFYRGWNLDLHLMIQQEKALWLARNSSIKAAKGEFVLLFDDDSRVESDWIFQHLKCIDFWKVDISSGVSLSVIGSNIPENYAYFRWSDQIDTGNVMFRKEIMEFTGMFDRQYEKQRQGDGEYGLRCYLLGLTNVSNHFAKRIHLKAAEGGLRQMGSWDGLRPKKLFAPRPVPSVLYLTRKYFGKHLSILMLMFSVPGSVIPYQYKSSRWLKVLAYFSLLLIWPVILTQVVISWQKASKKLKTGPLIEIYN